MQLENGTLIEKGSCVAPGECQEGVYALTYGPHASLWVSTACCENNCSNLPQQGGPQILKGCATPEVCNLHKNATLGPEDSGFHLTAKPECNYLTPPTQPGPHATVTHAKAETTICFTCSDLHSCGPLPCPEDNNYCLQMAGITAHLASHTLSEILCPTCPGSSLEPCNSSFYMRCPSGETECVQLDLTSEEGGWNVSVRGCGSRDLCSAPDWTHGLSVLPRHRDIGCPATAAPAAAPS
ncbi:uncharacterized protein LOC103880113 isoform X2 [Papio anubis]|uniref:uncharacterized protein LOC103880113 isoform X2 n=1 Tax=Papio anubis TaxID=9555 RepID=UPI0004F20142|nr:uncharacterized protein LOC103880113 isoform X2 [Papio anubis]